MKHRYDAKGIVGISLGEIELKGQPIAEWYSRSDEHMPIVRIKCGDGSEAFYALTKDAVDSFIRALADLQYLPVQKPHSTIQVQGQKQEREVIKID